MYADGTSGVVKMDVQYKQNGSDYVVVYDSENTVENKIDFSKARNQMSSVLPEYSKYFSIYLHPSKITDLSKMPCLSPTYSKTKIYKITVNEDDESALLGNEKDLSAEQVYYTLDGKILVANGVIDVTYGMIKGEIYTVTDYLSKNTIFFNFLSTVNEIRIYTDASNYISVKNN